MKLLEQSAHVKSKEDLVRFVEALRDDPRSNASEWENATLDRFLGALASWMEDSEGYYVNRGEPIPVTPSWKNIAEMLAAARIYE